MQISTLPLLADGPFTSLASPSVQFTIFTSLTEVMCAWIMQNIIQGLFEYEKVVYNDLLLASYPGL